MLSRKGVAGSDVARVRLRNDQLMRPIAEQRVELSILVRRLERAARGILITDLSERVRSDRRFAPVLGQLVQMALNS